MAEVDASRPAHVRALVGLGANLGDRGEALAKAVQSMAGLPETQVLRVSSLYASAPVDATGPDYLNAVAELRTLLAPLALLHALQAIEREAGRERPYRNAPRTLDLDLLVYADLQQNDPELTLPHPRMRERAFVLLPMAELAPEYATPAQLRSVADQRIERLHAPAQWCSGFFDPL